MYIDRNGKRGLLWALRRIPGRLFEGMKTPLTFEHLHPVSHRSATARSNTTEEWGKNSIVSVDPFSLAVARNPAGAIWIYGSILVSRDDLVSFGIRGADRAYSDLN